MLRIFTKHHKRLRYTVIKLACVIIFFAALFLPYYQKWEEPGKNIFNVFLNGEQVGVVSDPKKAEELLQDARRELVKDSEEIVFIDVDMSLTGEAVYWGKIDKDEDVQARMREIMTANIKETMQSSYVVKVNNYMVNLGSAEEVMLLLQTAIDIYDTEGRFQVELVHEDGREFNVLTADVVDTLARQEEEEAQENVIPASAGGVMLAFDSMIDDVEPAGEKDFSDFKLGLVSMDFAEDVEIVEAYMDVSQLSSVEQAIEEVIKEQEVNAVYEVQSGDTLSEISIKVNIPIERLIEMNDSLVNEKSVIRVGQELIITVPEPELSVIRQEEQYIEEIYDADVIYVDNDSWYTTQMVTLQEPSSGFRKIVAVISYTNDKETGREIIKEEIVKEAVPKIVERGTIIPPTYVKPVSGGRLTSGFGRRSAPTKGASTYHKGVDWAVSTGTPVYASCGGTVVKAGWGGGYGYVIYINHADGRQTRYAHLSRVLVSAGTQVSQGDRIGLSGNTGTSSGPHLHFEMLINGSQVNPLNYLD